jgi:hypothetical protein
LQCGENAVAWARIGVKMTAKSRAGLSGLTIAKSSNLTNGAHKRVLLADLAGTAGEEL